jgi:mannobiose 2-epimerase
MSDNERLIEEFQNNLINGIVKRWYPLVLDKECGGYFTNVSNDWTLPPEQEKMIVTQSRHIWTLTKVSAYVNNNNDYRSMALHGLPFLKNKMWDSEYGGFYQIRNREGGYSDVNGWRNEKRTYGNAFAIYALAALYEVTHDEEVLHFAQQAYTWIEEHAFDSKYKGYFEFLTREGQEFDHQSKHQTIASDRNELGYKDQNSSIHLLEAYTELYQVWKDPGLYAQLKSILELIREVMVIKEGYLQLFFHNDWSPVSFRKSLETERRANFGLDHVSFGHDYETAFLMLEASWALGLEHDIRTLTVAKRMLDHALQYGWDNSAGGFYDGGYYFDGQNTCSIIKDTKNWWAQAEGLNALLLFSRIFPQEMKYYEYFLRQWNYVKSNIIDTVGGDWYEGGIDKEPHFRNGPKSHMWKCTYHTCRALMNCISLLKENSQSHISQIATHWHSIAKELSE